MGAALSYRSSTGAENDLDINDAIHLVQVLGKLNNLLVTGSNVVHLHIDFVGLSFLIAADALHLSVIVNDATGVSCGSIDLSNVSIGATVAVPGTTVAIAADGLPNKETASVTAAGVHGWGATATASRCNLVAANAVAASGAVTITEGKAKLDAAGNEAVDAKTLAASIWVNGVGSISVVVAGFVQTADAAASGKKQVTFDRREDRRGDRDQGRPHARRRAKEHKLQPLPALSVLDRGPGLDALTLHCTATAGRDRGGDDAAVATKERD